MSFFDASGLEDWCRSADQKLKEAFDGAHSRVTVTQMDWRLLLRSAADRLLAVNAHSRTTLGRFLCEEIASKFCVNKDWEHDQPVFFGTLIPKGGLVSTGMLLVDLEGMKSKLRADLRGFSYVGMIEPAHYSSLPSTNGVPGGQAICWHLHLLIWAATTERIAKLTQKLRTGGNYVAVVEEFKSVHARQVANGELPDVVGYLLKPPSHAYRVTRYPWIGQGGEVRLKPNGTPQFYVTQLSSELRKGERVRVFHAMKHLGLDELLVGGGEGRVLRTRTLLRAAKEFDHRRRR